jgi:hypothetical protein
MDEAEHTPLGLRPALRLIKLDAVYGRNGVIIDRAEGGNQSRYEARVAGIFVAPGTCWVAPQHAASNVAAEV